MRPFRALIDLRDCVRTLIEYQTEDYPNAEIQAQQEQLNELYDAFVQKFGRVNARENMRVFRNDDSYYLLCSLEILDDEENFVRKADMFTKRTIRSAVPVAHVDTASEALTVSLGEKGRVDSRDVHNAALPAVCHPKEKGPAEFRRMGKHLWRNSDGDRAGP